MVVFNYISVLWKSPAISQVFDMFLDDDEQWSEVAGDVALGLITGASSDASFVDRPNKFHKAKSRGGSNADWNLCLACVDCNLSKSNKTLSEWGCDG